MQMHRVIAIVLFVGLACSRVAAADPFDDASAAYKRGDHETARRLFRPLAEKGNVGAQVNLANLYALQGEGVYAKEAALWYRKAAEQGHARSQSNLGALYSAGQGVPRDYVQAHMWFNLAASREDERHVRDSIVKNRDRVAKLMTLAQIAEAQRLAQDWKPK